MSILRGFSKFLFTNAILALLVGYGFFYVYTNLYPQYADNYLYLGIIAVVFLLFVSFSVKVSKRFG